LQTQVADAFAKLPRVRDRAELIATWDRFVCATLGLLVYFLGHRGTALWRLQMQALYLHPRYILVDDKDVGSHLRHRLLPKTAIVIDILNTYAEGLSRLSKSLKRLTLSHRGLPTLNDFGPRTQAFFQLLPHPTSARRVQRAQVNHAKLERTVVEAFGAKSLNVGRHNLVASLIKPGVKRHVVRVLTGHANSGAEVSGDASLLPPFIAIEELEESLEDINRSLGIPTVAGAPINASRIVGPLPTRNDVYLNPRVDEDYRILPPASDRFTPVGLMVTRLARRSLCEGNGPEGAGARFALSLACFDGLAIDDIKAIWETHPTAFRAAPAPSALWTRPGAMTISRPLNPMTTLLLLILRGTHSTDRWRHIMTDIGAWAQRALPNLRWPTDLYESALIILALSARFVRFHVPPASLAAESNAIAAATFTPQSIGRISAGTSVGAPPCPPARPSQQPRRWHASRGKPADIAEEVGHLVIRRNVKHINRGRAEAARRNLGAMVIEDHGPASALLLYIRHELRLQAQSNRDKLALRTLSDYVYEVVRAINYLQPYDDVSAWDALEWIEFVERVTPLLKKHPETPDPALHGLRRFLRIGAQLGWHIPRYLYTSRTQPRDRFRVAAASTVILAEDRTALLRDSQSAFVEDPILSQAAPLATSMFLELPLRSSEVFAQTCECVDRSTHSVAIQDGIHSHLKSANGRRLIVAPESLIDALDAYVRDSRTQSQYLFLDDGGFNWGIANEIQRWLTDAIRHVTASPDARIHSLRSAAEMEKLFPGWESLCRRLLRGEATPRECAAWIRSLAGNGFGALGESLHRMGLGAPITLITYYMPVWPLVNAAAMMATLVSEEPSPRLIEAALGRSDAYRQQKLRKGASFDPWLYLQERAARKLKLPALVTAAPTSDTPVTRTAALPATLRAPPSRLALTQYVRAGLATTPLTRFENPEAARRYGITSSVMREVTLILRKYDLDRISRRQRGAGGSGGHLAVVRRLETAFADQLLHGLLSARPEDLDNLLDDLGGTDCKHHKPTTDELISRLTTYLPLIPATHGFRVRPSKEFADSSRMALLVALFPRVQLGKPVRSGPPTLQVCSVRTLDNSVELGWLTPLTRMTALAIRIADRFRTKE
jgi:integrase